MRAARHQSRRLEGRREAGERRARIKCSLLARGDVLTGRKQPQRDGREVGRKGGREGGSKTGWYLKEGQRE